MRSIRNNPGLPRKSDFTAGVGLLPLTRYVAAADEIKRTKPVILVDALNPISDPHRPSSAVSGQKIQFNARKKIGSMECLDRAIATATARTGKFVREHPRSLMSALSLSLMGFGVTAFGIAPLAPDASDLPRRLITETVVPENPETQLELLASHKLQLYRSDFTRSTDTIDTLFQRLGINDVIAAAYMRTDRIAAKVLEGRPSKMIQARTGQTGELQEFIARFSAENSDRARTHFSRLRITRTGGHLQTQIEEIPLEMQIRIGSGTIQNSLLAATDEARIPDAVTIQMAEIFSNEIDFHSGLRKGDAFSVVYEVPTADGESISWNQTGGRVLGAEFTNNGRSRSAVWYKDEEGEGRYFSFEGLAKRRAFLASPLEFSRVTSGYSMRFHPILKDLRAHLGVDYGAPDGTPVRSVGDGVVEFAGWKSGYGNVVEVEHSDNRATFYAHLSRIYVREGQKISQGANIGEVGSTGLATGPHLHFEFRVKGQHQNPMAMAKASEIIALSPSAHEQFSKYTQALQQQLDAAKVAISRQRFTE